MEKFPTQKHQEPAPKLSAADHIRKILEEYEARMGAPPEPGVPDVKEVRQLRTALACAQLATDIKNILPVLEKDEQQESERDPLEVDLGWLMREAKRIADDHGFTDNTIGEDIALIHSEASEALEEFRNGRALTETYYEKKEPISKPCGYPSEMADLVIRVAHHCERHGVDLVGAILDKMRYNASRPYRHGGKKL